MRVAISNLAWQPEEDRAVRDLLVTLGVGGVELAPTKLWADPTAALHAEVEDYRDFWESAGIRVTALQSLLFGRPDLALFGNDNQRAALLDHLTGLCRLGGWLGVEALVFGSPGNRRRGALGSEAADGVAVPFFRRAGEAAAEHGVGLCIEANPVEYGCDFVTSVAEAVRLVAAVNHPGFGLHLDTGGLALTGELQRDTLVPAARLARYAHVSEPYLAETGTVGTDHIAAAAALREAGYEGWVSVEMRGEGADNLARVERALVVALKHYGSDGG